MKRTGMIWPWAMAGILGATVTGNIWVMRVAGADASFAVEPEYYRRALAWDSTMADAARSTALGWRAEAELHHAADGPATLAVALHDADGLPLAGAMVRVEARHLARAGEMIPAQLMETSTGRYAATLPTARRGIWELRLDARRGGERFTATLRYDSSRSPER